MTDLKMWQAAEKAVKLAMAQGVRTIETESEFKEEVLMIYTEMKRDPQIAAVVQSINYESSPHYIQGNDTVH